METSQPEKFIITAAITGAVHTPSMSPYLPLTPEQIADEAVKAGEAGAAIVHIHVREPETGKPTSDLDLFRKVLKDIRNRSDVIINTTTGGGFGMTLPERLRVVPSLKPEMASFNMGSMNIALYPYLSKMKSWKFDWEKPYIEMTRDFVFKNTFADMEQFCKTMYENGTVPELECFGVAHIYNAQRLVIDGVLKTPMHIQMVLGLTGGIGTGVEDLLMMKQTADRVIGPGKYTWSVAAAGRHQLGSCVTAARLGGHPRVGLEDNLYLTKGVLAKSSSEQVVKVRSLLYDITGKEAATPDEARTMLGLKGKDKVNF